MGEESLFQQTALCVATELIPWRTLLDAGKWIGLIEVGGTDPPRHGINPMATQSEVR